MAFDLFKSALDSVLTDISKQSADEIDLEKVRVTYHTILKVFEKKDSAHTPLKSIQSQSRQNILVLRTMAELFEEVGEEKLITLS